MSTLPGSFEVEGVTCWPDNEPDLFHYLPPGPRAEPDASGQPNVMLTDLPGLAFLQFGTRLDLPAEKQDAVRRAIAGRPPVRRIDSVRLTPGVQTVSEAVLTLTTPDHEPVVLGTATPSGYPPYPALFHARLTTAQRDAVFAAVRDGKGLEVSYRVTVPSQFEASCRLSAPRGLTASPTDRSHDGLREWVREAIRSGDVELLTRRTAGTPDGVAEEATRQAEDKFAVLLALRGTTNRGEALTAEAVVRAAVPLEIIVNAEVGSWFTGGGAVRVISAAAPT